MKFHLKKITIIFLIFFDSIAFSHTAHYLDFKQIEMEILKDGKVIGYNYYFFKKENGIVSIKNQIYFKVHLFGVPVFNLEGYGIEKYNNGKLISYESKTKQNDKKKFVNLIFDKDKDKFYIKGSSYTGEASVDSIIGNWWNHKILQADSQVSPISGSIKEQVVTFLGKEKIKQYGQIYEVDHFKLKSKDTSLPKDKRLDFDIWYDKKNSIVIKVSYSRMGNWEYRLKSFE